MKAFVVIAALACVLPTASVAQRYTVYGQPGISGSYTRIGLGIAGCGPPNFNCSNQSLAVANTPTMPILTAINSTGYAYSSPTDFYYPSSGRGNCYTALSDSTSRVTPLHASWSGGGGNVMSDVNRAYFAATDTNGNLFYFHVHYDANGCMQTDSNMSAGSLSGGSLGGFTFSRVTPATAYKVTHKNGDGTLTGLYQENLSGTTTVSVTRTLLFDYNNCPGVDGTLTTQGGNGNLNVDAVDNRFSTSLNFPPAINGQDGAHWVLVWDRATNSCSSYYTGTVQNAENPANGNWWTWCSGNCSQHGSNPAPAGLNTTCAQPGYGVHGTAGMTNGQYIMVSGSCDPVAANNNTAWQFGTGNVQTCNGSLHNCGGHGANGYSTLRMNNAGLTIRSVRDLSTYTLFRASPAVDLHGGANWHGIAGDTNPWMASTQAGGAVGGSCTGGYLCFELIAIRLDGTIARFAPNFYAWPAGSAGGGLGPIPAMTQDGYCMTFESTWGGTRGVDASGHFRTDLFAICNLQ